MARGKCGQWSLNGEVSQAIYTSEGTGEGLLPRAADVAERAGLDAPDEAEAKDFRFGFH